MNQITLLLRQLTLGPYYGLVIRRSIRQVRRSLTETLPPIVKTLHYGAVSIDPKYLAICFVVATDADLARAKAGGLDYRIKDETRAALMRNGYPTAALPEVLIELESQETVDKEGGWHIYKH